MDVTTEILQNHLVYGASENTAPAGLSSSRSLNYANGPTITRPDNILLASIPYTLKYQDTIGLFGSENYYVKIRIKINLDYVNACFEEDGWACAVVRDVADSDAYYYAAVINEGLDPAPVNTYDPAYMNEAVTGKENAYVSVDLKNLKTGNIYVDSWLDTRLYTSSREEHPYDKMYVRENDYFYLGIHARNTRRLPYNIECIVGNEYVSRETMTDEESRYIARQIN
jgi:hypothetical protein